MAAYFGLFLLPMERRHSQRNFEPYGNAFSSFRAALTNRQYSDHFMQHGFSSSSAVPLGHFGHTIDMANSRNTVNVPLIGLFAKRLCEDFFSVLGNTV